MPFPIHNSSNIIFHIGTIDLFPLNMSKQSSLFISKTNCYLKLNFLGVKPKSDWNTSNNSGRHITSLGNMNGRFQYSSIKKKIISLQTFTSVYEIENILFFSFQETNGDKIPYVCSVMTIFYITSFCLKLTYL